MIDGDDGPEELDLPLFEEGPTDSVELELDDDDVGGNLADYLEEFEEEGEIAEDEEVSEEEDDSEDEPEEAEAEDDDQVEPEEEEEEEPRPRKRDAERRISELSRRAQEAEQRAQEIEARLQQESALRQQSDLAMMTHYEQRLRGDANVVLGQIEEAISMGDGRKQAELQAQFNQLQNDLSGIDAWRKDAEAKMAEAQQAPAQPEPKQQQQVTLEPRTRDWIEKNPWFQPQSADFDAEMHEEATMFARRLERRFKADGRADEIGSSSYFKEIDKHMRAEFADAIPDRSAPKKATPKMKRENTVAPVVRSGGSDSPTKRTAKVSLSPAERQFARNMAASGAYKKPNGQRMSDAEAERYHAAFMLKQRKG
jgi:hypothetical protein